jgi:acyl carrier protein
MDITPEKLMEFLEHELAVDVTDVQEHTPLFSAGIVDSFAVISLMTYLETEGGIRIDPDDVNLENMDSIGRILDFVARVKV